MESIVTAVIMALGFFASIYLLMVGLCVVQAYKSRKDK